MLWFRQVGYCAMGHSLRWTRRCLRRTALAIQGDRIVFVGEESEVDQWIGEHTKVLDLNGAFVYPGFIDSHAHIVAHGSVKKNYLALEGLDKATILERVAQRATTQKEGEWIVGLGWDEGIWSDKELPSAHELDCVAPRHPVKLTRVDTHSVWVNHEALRRAKIDKDTPDPAGGKIFRDPQGNPTGILLDQAAKLIYQVMPKQNLQETIELTQEALQEALPKGITMIHNAVTFQDELDSFKVLAKEDALPVRIYAMVLVPDKCGEDFLEKGPQKFGPYLEVSCLKFFIDGALGSRGSALLEPYTDLPTTKGLILWQEADLLPILQRAKTKGFQVAFHAIGDAANRIVLDLYEKVGVRGLRWRYRARPIAGTL